MGGALSSLTFRWRGGTTVGAVLGAAPQWQCRPSHALYVALPLVFELLTGASVARVVFVCRAQEVTIGWRVGQVGHPRWR